MSSSLSVVGLFWAIISFFTAGVACCCYLLPYWLTSGTARLSVDTTFLPISFGTFRRCGYVLPFDHTTSIGDGPLLMAEDCGRYMTFTDIPSVWWQVATVVIGVGCCTSLLVAFTALACCCVGDVMSGTVARVACVVQFFGGLSITVGCALFPMGWDNPEVRMACGDASTRFNPGDCRISWAYWAMVGCAGATLVCSLLALSSPRRHGGYQRAPVRP